MKTWLASFCAVTVLSCTIAFAQTEPSKDEADPAKIAVATRILEQTRAMDNMSLMLGTMVPVMVNAMKQQTPQISDDVAKLMSDMLLEEMRKDLPSMMAIQARLYAGHYTLEELQSIEQFYQSPVGQKTIAEAPKIVQETAPLGMAWGQRAAQAALPRVIEKLRAQGVKI